MTNTEGLEEKTHFHSSHLVSVTIIKNCKLARDFIQQQKPETEYIAQGMEIAQLTKLS